MGELGHRRSGGGKASGPSILELSHYFTRTPTDWETGIQIDLSRPAVMLLTRQMGIYSPEVIMLRYQDGVFNGLNWYADQISGCNFMPMVDEQGYLSVKGGDSPLQTVRLTVIQ